MTTRLKEVPSPPSPDKHAHPSAPSHALSAVLNSSPCHREGGLCFRLVAMHFWSIFILKGCFYSVMIGFRYLKMLTSRLFDDYITSEYNIYTNIFQNCLTSFKMNYLHSKLLINWSETVSGVANVWVRRRMCCLPSQLTSCCFVVYCVLTLCVWRRRRSVRRRSRNKSRPCPANWKRYAPFVSNRI